MKGQQDVLTLIVITAVLVGVIAVVWLWTTPITERNKDVFRLRSTEDFVKNLASSIKLVAQNGGTAELSMTGLDPKGTILISDGIDVLITTKDTLYEKNIQIPLGDIPCSTTEATWGLNRSDVICITSTALDRETMRTTFSVKFVQLNSNSKAYKIEILPIAGSSGLDKKSIIIQNVGIKESVSGGRNLISTLVAISIV